MESIEDAAYLVANARVLRRSRDEMVKQTVFVSADLTPAEAKAAYDIRCRRRQFNERNQHSLPVDSLTAIPNNAVSATACSTAGRH